MHPKRTIWLHPEQEDCVQIIDQRSLPHRLVIENLHSYQDAAQAIREMHVRGAPLIGATAAWGFYLATLAEPNINISDYYQEVAKTLANTRPTAVDLFYAIAQMQETLASAESKITRQKASRNKAAEYVEQSVAQCRLIGEHGLSLLQALYQEKGRPLQILTHCNAGWLACIEYGTATAPIYLAHQQGIPLHVWVDETRPRLQGARLTAYELGQAGVLHTIIADNTAGHLMQRGEVDLVIVGSDRTTRQGDVANKIGTYTKALAAKDNNIPFYVALPSSSIDWTIKDGISEIPIETRTEDEVHRIPGQQADGSISSVRISPNESPALNYGFDVTPARLVTGLITERGICAANEQELMRLFKGEHPL